MADFVSVSWFYILNEFSINLLYINLINIQVKKNKLNNTGFYIDFFFCLGVIVGCPLVVSLLPSTRFTI